MSKMKKQSARFSAGHFFHGIIIFLLLLIVAGCSSEPPTSGADRELTETGAITILIQFPDAGTDDSMPEAVSDLPLTAGGRLHFHAAGHDSTATTTCIRIIAQEADRTGKLLIMIIPDGEQFSGTRDHLVIWIDSLGIPAKIKPQVDSGLFADSLWRDPVVRQQTILELIHFFKPDMVIQTIPEITSSYAVTRFWSEHGAENNATVALHAPSLTETSFRGWGIFTGKGIRTGLLEGMDLPGFIATVKMISGMDWNNNGQGYPAMQAFYATETE